MSRKEFVQEFQKRLALQFPTGFQHKWTRFIFNFSDIHNISSILNSGKLYSRAKAIELGLMKHDNANTNVINNTIEQYKNYVRFYFGAKTPTLYMNEGIKPKKSIKDNAHCPVPVFLLFDFVKLLSIENASFSNGNLAAKDVEVYTNVKDLNRLEFHNIYHREPLPNDNRRKHIQYCRHAEVLIPNEVNVYDYLEYVYVRSQAEKETLLYGLDQEAKRRLKNKIMVFTKDGLFFAKELFINNVYRKHNQVVIDLSLVPFENFEIVLYGKDLETNKIFNTVISSSITNSVFSWHIRDFKMGRDGFEMKIEIDGHLVYQNILDEQTDEIF